MLKLGKINREKKCKIIQKSTGMIDNIMVHLLNVGGGLFENVKKGAYDYGRK